MRGLCYFFLSILTQGKSIFSAFLFSCTCGVVVGVKVAVCVQEGGCIRGLHTLELQLQSVSSSLIKVTDVPHSVFQHPKSHWPLWGQCDFALWVRHSNSRRPESLLGTREGAQVQMLRHRPLVRGWGCGFQAVPQVPAAGQGDGRRRVPDHPEHSVD